MGTAVAYGVYALWALALMMLLPMASGGGQFLVLLGIASAAFVGIGLVAFGILLLMHISQTKASPLSRKRALIKLIVFVIPGVLLSIAMPLMIMREPPLVIEITSPLTSEEMVAPVQITFDVAQTARVLISRGFRPVQYKWDLNGDRKVDQETLEPTLTATFDREGIYTVSVSMIASNGAVRGAARRFVISQSVFSVVPANPIIEEPAVFSLAHLFPDGDDVVSVEWDFDGDGKMDDTTTTPEASFTYYKTGRVTVSALVQLSNRTQAQYERSIEVKDPPSLPFPVRIVTEPATLISSAPFSALFSIETQEPIANIQWTFGDGDKGEGPRVAHTFTRKGSFAVQARVRSQSGVVADIGTVVRIVDRLDVPDLSFEGSPEVSGTKIQGEVPLTVTIKPVTQKPFIEFSWEAPGATDVGSTSDTLQAIYRREGTYVVYLIAQDLEDHVLRMPLTVTVKPASSELVIAMEPTAGVAPLRVRFDASESSIPGEEITGFIWGFGDGSAKEFGGASTEHTYTRAGTYLVDLSVRTTSGKQFTATKSLVVREPLLQACFQPSRLEGEAPLGVEFDTRCTTGSIKSYVWDFGDQSQSDEKSPIHVFMNPGTYRVQLRVTDDTDGTSLQTSTITVR